jgi:hypothetical protein
MSEADLLQPGNIVRERWKVVSRSIFFIKIYKEILRMNYAKMMYFITILRNQKKEIFLSFYAHLYSDLFYFFFNLEY